MSFVTIVTIALLIILGLFHLYWSFGGKVGLDKALPTKDGKPLINPGRTLTFIVGILLFVFAFEAYSLRFDVQIAGYVVYAGWTLSALFILRAIGEFNTVGFFKKIKSTDFAEYDTKYFSPLSAYLGVVFAILSSLA